MCSLSTTLSGGRHGGQAIIRPSAQLAGDLMERARDSRRVVAGPVLAPVSDLTVDHLRLTIEELGGTLQSPSHRLLALRGGVVHERE